jgi:hypothetical protein
MPYEQYDKPTTLREADQNIACIQRCQRELRDRGRTTDAAGWDSELIEQQQAREEIKQQGNAALSKIFRSIHSK